MADHSLDKVSTSFCKTSFTMSSYPQSERTFFQQSVHSNGSSKKEVHRKFHVYGLDRTATSGGGNVLATTRTPCNGNVSPGHATLLEKKRKLYRETQQLPLWGIRKIVINSVDRDDLSRFPDNSLRTCHFKLWSFFPKLLWSQCHRLSNIWYFSFCIFHTLSVFYGKWTPVYHFIPTIPFLITLCIAGGLEAFEDYKRYITDLAINGRPSTIVDGRAPQFKTTTWKALRVGNVVRLREGEEVPADIVLLATSNTDGTAYVQTSSFDGQSHYKEKIAVKETRGEVTAHAISNVRGCIVCEQPGANLEAFSGSLRLDAHPRVTPLDLNSFIIRGLAGSRVRNTEWLHGVVIYTGPDTRIARNIQLRLPYKYSQIQSDINKLTALLVAFIIFITFILTMFGIQKKHHLPSSLIPWSNDIDWFYLSTHFMTRIIGIVPFTMTCILDIVRYIQGVALSRDPMMTQRTSDTQSICSRAGTTRLNDMLGLVDFVFADKTGTITNGDMKFACCSVGGRWYGSGSTRRHPVRKVQTKHCQATEKERKLSDEKIPDSQRIIKQSVGIHTLDTPDQVSDSFLKDRNDISNVPKSHSIDALGSFIHTHEVHCVKRTRNSTYENVVIDCPISQRNALSQVPSCNIKRINESKSDRVFDMLDCNVTAFMIPDVCCMQSKRLKLPQEIPSPRLPLDQHHSEHLNSQYLQTPRNICPKDTFQSYFNSNTGSCFESHIRLPQTPVNQRRSLNVTKADAMAAVEPQQGQPMSNDNQIFCNDDVSNCPSSPLHETANAKGQQVPSPLKAINLLHGTRKCKALLSENEPLSYKNQKNVLANNQIEGKDSHTFRQGHQHDKYSCSSQQPQRKALNTPMTRHTQRCSSTKCAKCPNFCTNQSEKSLTATLMQIGEPVFFPNDSDELEDVFPPEGEIALQKRRLDVTHKWCSLCQNEDVNATRKLSHSHSMPPRMSNLRTDFRRRAVAKLAMLNVQCHSKPAPENLPRSDTRKPLVGFCPRYSLIPSKFRSLGAYIDSKTSFRDVRILLDSHKNDSRGKTIVEFFKAMALCNSVVPRLNLASMLYQLQSSPVTSFESHRAAAPQGKRHRSAPPIHTKSLNSPSKPASVPVKTDDFVGSTLKSSGNAQRLISSEQKHSAGKPDLNASVKSCFSMQAKLMIGEGRSTPRKQSPSEDETKRNESRGKQSLSGPEAIDPSEMQIGSSTNLDTAFKELDKLSAFPSDCRNHRDVLSCDGESNRFDANQVKKPWKRSPSRDRTLLGSFRYCVAFPEEICLVAGAACAGFSLISRTSNFVQLEFNGLLKRYEVFGINNFSSDRQRMSICVRPVGHSYVTLYCKGSVDVMLPLCSAKNQIQVSKEKLMRHIKRLRVRGLRSIIIASRTLTLGQADAYRRLCCEAKIAFQKTGEYTNGASCFEEDMQVLGVAGIKDGMDPGTPDAMTSIMESGVRIWVVTGDVSEIALQASYSSQILSQRTKLFKATLKNKGYRGRREALLLYEDFKTEMLGRSPNEPVALLTTGADLANFLCTPDLQTVFFSMACSCDTVICSKTKPVQKALLAKLLRANVVPEPVILAVGDGLNDIAMMQASQCAVAVDSGAASSFPYADFVIPSIEYLKPLMFIHGRLSYIRISSVTSWLCYKAFYPAIPLALYIRQSNYSSAFLYMSSMYYLYDCLCTALPVIIHGITEEDVPKSIVLKLPVLYTLSRRRVYLNLYLYLMQIVQATLAGALHFYLISEMYLKKSPQGIPITTIELGTEILFQCLVTCLIKLCFATHRYTVSFLLSTFVFGLVGWFLGVYFILEDDCDGPQNFIRWKDSIGMIDFCAHLMLIVGACTLIEVVVIEVLKSWNPKLSDSVRSAALKRQQQQQNQPSLLCPNVNDQLKSMRTTQKCKATPQATVEKLLERFNPIRHRRVAQRLPRPRRFRLIRSNSQGGGYYAPLPLVTSIDRLTILSQLKHRDRDRLIHQPFAAHAFSATRANVSSSLVTKRNSTALQHLKAEAKQKDWHLMSANNFSLEKNSKKENYLNSDVSLTEKDSMTLSTSDGTCLTGSKRSLSDEEEEEDDEDAPCLASNEESGLVFHRSEDEEDNEDDDNDQKINGVTVTSNSNNRIVIKVSDLIDLMTLKFRDQQLEADYQVHRKKDIRKYRVSFRFIILFLCLLTMIVLIYNFFVLRVDHKFANIDVIMSLLPDVTVFIFFLASLYDFLFFEKFDLLIGGFVVVIAAFKLLSDYVQMKDGVTTAAIFSVLIFAVIRIPFFHALIYNTIFTLLFGLRYALSVFRKSSIRAARSRHTVVLRHLFLSGMGGSDKDVMSYTQLLHYMPMLLGIQAFVGFVGYRLEYNQRKGFLLDYQVEVSRRKQREILNTMLPAFIVDQMLSCTITKDGIPVGIKAEDKGTVSVVFCDVYEFQKVVACVEPTHLVKVLDSLFLCFDKCAEQFGCAKIETVFETYLAAAGLRFGEEGGGESEDSKQDAYDALDMSLAMLEIAKCISYEITDDSLPPDADSIDDTNDNFDESWKDAAPYPLLMPGPTLNLRPKNRIKRIRVKIGIHSGRVISGVVGAKKPQFALFGDTINTASRMKTTGEADMVHVSEATYSLIKEDDSLVWEERHIEVKGKGLMSTYLLTGVPGEDADIVEPPCSERSRAPMDAVRTVRFETRRNYRARTNASSPLVPGSSPATPLDEMSRLLPNSSLGMKNVSPNCFELRQPTSEQSCSAKITNISSQQPPSNDEKSMPMRQAKEPSKINLMDGEVRNTESSKSSQRGSVRFKALSSYTSPETDVASSLSRQSTKFAMNNTSLDDTLSPSIVEGKSPCRRFWSSLWGSRDSSRKEKNADVKNRYATAVSTQSYSNFLTHRSSFSFHSSAQQKCRKSDCFCPSIPMRWLFLTFKDREVEERYKMHFYSNSSNINTIEQALIIFLMAFVVQTLVLILFPQYSLHGSFTAKPAITWAVRSIFSAAAFVLWLLLHYRDRAEVSSMFGIRWLIFLLNLNFITAASTFMLANSWSYNYKEHEKPLWLYNDTLQLFVYITILHHNSGLLFQHVVLVNALLLAVAMTFIIVVAQSTPIAIEGLFMIPIFIVSNVLSAFFKEYVDRSTFIVNEEMQTTEDRGRELLHDMLPKQVLEEFQQDKLKLAYQHERITFLFADICGFTNWAKDVEAREVVQMLQQLFARFDRDSTRFGLYKLCTIGDAYVAVSEPVTEDTVDYDPANGAERVLEMAHSMIENIMLVRDRLQIPNLNMRIGLHFGKCVGGVIGSGRLRYDLWGLDVLTANLIESGGIPGQICVSAPLKEFLTQFFPGRFRFQFHKHIWVINHDVSSYILIEEATNDSESSIEPDRFRNTQNLSTNFAKVMTLVDYAN